LAPLGQAPYLKHRARHRDKVSLAAALTLSPSRGHVSLYYQTYPNLYVDSLLYARFVRDVLWHVRGPLVLLHDGGTMHKGEPIRNLQDRFPRLHVHRFPAYAPELNPPEYLWTDVKYHRLGNYVPKDLAQMERTACIELEQARHDQQRLRSYFLSSPLPWNATGLF
jgi:transposase